MMALSHERPLNGFDRQIGGSAGVGTHGGRERSRPRGMPSRSAADYRIRTPEALRSAVREPNVIVYIDAPVVLRTSSPIDIAPGVQLVGGFCDPSIAGRGPVVEYAPTDDPETAHGAMFQYTDSSTPPTFWGVSFRGPGERTGTADEILASTSGVSVRCPSSSGAVRMIGCEFWDFTTAGVVLGDDACDPTVVLDRCSIHNTQQANMGVGIQQRGGHLTCMHSFFSGVRNGITTESAPTVSLDLETSVFGPGREPVAVRVQRHNTGGEDARPEPTGGVVTVRECTVTTTGESEESGEIVRDDDSAADVDVSGCTISRRTDIGQPSASTDTSRGVDRVGQTASKRYEPTTETEETVPDGGAPRESVRSLHGEQGTVRLDALVDDWTTITVDGYYQNPVVVTSPVIDGSGAYHCRIRNVTATSFECRLDPTAGRPTTSPSGTVSYLVVEEGHHELENGGHVVAGTTDGTTSFEPVSLETSFSTVPIVLSHVQTADTDGPVLTEVRSVQSDGFDIAVANQSGENVQRSTVGYLAISPGSDQLFGSQLEVNRTLQQVSDQWYNITYQSDWTDPPAVFAAKQTCSERVSARVDVRSRRADGTSVRLDRLDSGGPPGVNEAIGCVIVEPADRIVGTPRGEYRTVTVGLEPDARHSIDFADSYVDPVVVVHPLCEASASAVCVRIQNVGPTGFDCSIAEPQAVETTEESISLSYLVLEAGRYSLDDGSQLIAGTTTADESFRTFGFDSGFETTPVVLTTVQRSTDESVCVPRTRGITPDSFSLALQRGRQNEFQDAATVGFVALEPGERTHCGTSFEVGRTPIRHDWGERSFEEDRAGVPVVLADLQTCSVPGVQTIGYRSITDRGLTVRLRSPAQSGDTSSTTERIGYLASKAPRVLYGSPQGSFDDVTLVQDAEDWHSVAFDRPYTNPVVIMQPVSFRGEHPCRVRLRNVTETGFEFALVTAVSDDSSDTTPESVSFIVLEAGAYQLPGGARILAGHTERRPSFEPVSFQGVFDTTPVVLSQTQTNTGRVIARNRSVTTDGMECGLVGTSLSDAGVTATVGFLAVEPGHLRLFDTLFEVDRADRRIDHVWTPVQFDAVKTDTPAFLADVQSAAATVPSSITYRNRSHRAIDLAIHTDTNTRTAQETVGYLVSQTDPPTGTQLTGELTTHTVAQTADEWHEVSFENRYSNPVVVMKPVSGQGSNPTQIRLRNVTPFGFEFSVAGWGYLGGSHTTVTVSALVLEAGAYTLQDGTPVVVDTTQVGSEPVDVSVPSPDGTSFTERPIVFSQPQTMNGPATVVSRTDAITTAGLTLHLFEGDRQRATTAETVGYIALPAGIHTIADRDVEVGRTDPRFDQKWRRLSFSKSWSRDGQFLAAIQSLDTTPISTVRYRSLSHHKVHCRIDHDNSGDTAPAGTEIGYLITGDD